MGFRKEIAETMSKPIRAYLYARISTADGRQTLERQRRDLKKFAADAQWKVVATAEDTISGSSRQRPGLDTVLRAAQDQKMDILCVTEISRLSRSGVMQVIELIQTLKKNGVDVWSITEPHLRTSGPYGELFLAVAAAIAKIEIEHLRTRILSGVSNAKAAGKVCNRPRRIVDLTRIVELKAQGLGVRAIGKELGISKSVVQSRIKELEALAEPAK